MNTDTLPGKGTHPGMFLKSQLHKKGIGSGRFALDMGEYPQNITAVINGNRRMSVKLGLKCDKAFGFQDGHFAVLQVFYDMQLLKAVEVPVKNIVSKLPQRKTADYHIHTNDYPLMYNTGTIKLTDRIMFHEIAWKSHDPFFHMELTAFINNADIVKVMKLEYDTAGFNKWLRRVKSKHTHELGMRINDYRHLKVKMKRHA